MEDRQAKLQTDFKDVERNENENRTQLQTMAQQIDDREEIIEKLEYELEVQRKKNRDMFKQQMKQPYGKNKQQNMRHSDFSEKNEEESMMKDELIE